MPLSAPSVSTRIRSELPHLLKLAGPVVAAELGWMLMGVVDTVMVGKIGAEAIGAVAIGNIVFNCIGLLSIGIMLGLDTLVSQAFGAGDIEDCNHSLRQSLWMGAIAGPVLLLVMQLVAPSMRWWGIDTSVIDLSVPFTQILAWSVLPIMLYAAFRRYLQSMGKVRPVMFALVSANLINWIFNWILIGGHLGIPALGVRGSAIATILARTYMAAVLFWAIPSGVLRLERPDWKRIRVLFHLGLPAAGHIFLEIAVFGAATALAGRFPPFALAAHEIALNTAALTYMVPLGISSATAVRVGHAIGRKDLQEARIAGWTGILTGVGFMALSGVMMLLFASQILGVYTTDIAVVNFGVPLLYCAAAFQLFDGTQVVSTGALRGLGDTRTAFAANMIGYWLLGLPVGAGLCFYAGWGVVGLWVGLTVGLTTAAFVLLRQWMRKTA